MYGFVPKADDDNALSEISFYDNPKYRKTCIARKSNIYICNYLLCNLYKLLKHFA